MGQVNSFRPEPVQEYAVSQGPPSKPAANEAKVKPGANTDTFTGPGIFTVDAEKPGNAANAGNFKPVYSVTEEQTLGAVTKNFDLIAGNDNNKDTISKKDIQAQIETDEAFLKDSKNWVGKSGTEVGEIFLRHNSLKNLEANFDNYAKNGEIDLPTLQTAYKSVTTGQNVKLTDDQKAKIEPLVNPDGSASDMFGDIAKAGPNSSGGTANDPQGTNIDAKDLDSAIANGNKPNATNEEKAAANTAQNIKSDPGLMAMLTQSSPGGVFAERSGFTIADVKRLLGTT